MAQLASGRASAQAVTPTSVRLQSVGYNALTAGVVSGIRATLRRRPLRRALAIGAAGGALTSVARQAAGSRGMLGGVGARTAQSFGLLLGSLAVDDSCTVPLQIGPVVLRWRLGERARPMVRLNLTQLVALGVIAGRASSLNWRSSLLAGTPVLMSRISTGEPAFALPGVIVLASKPDQRASYRLEELRSHELIHVLQLEAAHEWVGNPIEQKTLSAWKPGRKVLRFVELGVVGPALLLSTTRIVQYDRSPTELEAWWIAHGHRVPQSR
jgi:hypothetical protein